MVFGPPGEIDYGTTPILRQVFRANHGSRQLRGQILDALQKGNTQSRGDT